jgi:asparagine synthase (glutamine-hydrolysing)
MKQDQMSMAASLESRVPYLDHLLVEQVMRIPGDQRMRRWQTKVILREALRKMVPPAVMNRSKMGFPVPFGSWVRGPFRTILDEYVLSTVSSSIPGRFAGSSTSTCQASGLIRIVSGSW